RTFLASGKPVSIPSTIVTSWLSQPRDLWHILAAMSHTLPSIKKKTNAFMSVCWVGSTEVPNVDCKPMITSLPNVKLTPSFQAIQAAISALDTDGDGVETHPGPSCNQLSSSPSRRQQVFTAYRLIRGIVHAYVIECNGTSKSSRVGGIRDVRHAIDCHVLNASNLAFVSPTAFSS
ncbi:hypothetical protein CORC01_08167, partial [Colletotrichum orchidophilum]